MCASARVRVRVRAYARISRRHTRSDVPAPRPTDAPAHRSIGTSARRHVGTPTQQHIDAPAHRRTGAPEHRSTGAPEHRHTGVPIRSRFGNFDSQSGTVFPLPPFFRARARLKKERAKNFYFACFQSLTRRAQHNLATKGTFWHAYCNRCLRHSEVGEFPSRVTRMVEAKIRRETTGSENRQQLRKAMRGFRRVPAHRGRRWARSAETESQ